MEGASDRAPNRRLKQLLRVSRPNEEENIVKLNKLPWKPVYAMQQQVPPTITPPEPEDIPYPLTKQEALSFLENVLEITNPLELLRRDRMAFLNAYIYNMITKVPFSNFPHIYQPMKDKHSPTFEECKMALFRREGGHCYYKNVFSKALLDLMDYKTYHVGGNNVGEDQYDTHCGIIVCDLSYPGSLHLAEPGTKRPLYQAIPLDFEVESPVHKFHYMRSKFFKREHGLLLWCAEAKDETKPSDYVLESEGTYWKVQLMYRLNVKKNRSFYLEKGRVMFGLPSLMPQLQSRAYFVGYIGKKILSIMYGGGFIGGMMIKHEDPFETEQKYLTGKEVVEVTMLHFPQYSKQMLQRVIDNVKYNGNLYSL